MASEKEQREFSTQEHWDSRYTGDREDQLGEHEWLGDFKTLQPFLTKHLPTPDPTGDASPRILHLGCGTSEITQKLHEQGYQQQDNVDFSPVAIKLMQERHGDLDGVKWHVMDIRKMDFASDTFDIVIDKGTLDAMIWGSLWDPNDEVKANVAAYASEVARCLKPGGKWLWITFRQPHFVRPLLQQSGGDWNMSMETLCREGASFEYFGWILEKK